MKPAIASFEDEISSRGVVIFNEIVPGDLLARLRQDLPGHQAACQAIAQRNGVGAGLSGAAHHVLGGRDSLDDFFHQLFLDEYIRSFFQGPYILNSYGAINNLTPSSDGYKHGQQFHRDVRTYSNGFRLMLNMLVMVDDFTTENGATKLVPGSHRVEARPDDDFLEQNCIRATGPAGCIVLFDSNIWHSAAPNTTSNPRRALTLTFARPFFKQQLDYPRLLGEEYTADERIRQVLGYNSRVPASRHEWYQPPERRMYRPGQG